MAKAGAVRAISVAVQRFLPILVLALACVAVPWLVFSPTGLAGLNQLREERQEAEAEISRLSQEIRELRVQVARIKSDPSAVEQVARDELGLVRQTEIVFQFKD